MAKLGSSVLRYLNKGAGNGAVTKKVMSVVHEVLCEYVPNLEKFTPLTFGVSNGYVYRHNYGDRRRAALSYNNPAILELDLKLDSYSITLVQGVLRQLHRVATGQVEIDNYILEAFDATISVAGQTSTLMSYEWNAGKTPDEKFGKAHLARLNSAIRKGKSLTITIVVAVDIFGTTQEV